MLREAIGVSAFRERGLSWVLGDGIDNLPTQLWPEEISTSLSWLLTMITRCSSELWVLDVWGEAHGTVQLKTNLRDLWSDG